MTLNLRARIWGQAGRPFIDVGLKIRFPPGRTSKHPLSGILFSRQEKITPRQEIFISRQERNAGLLA